MENTAYEKERVSVYENYHAPDVVVIRHHQPVMAQPTAKPRTGEPIANNSDDDGTCENQSETKHGTQHVPRESASADKIYSLDGEQNSRDWSSDLFFSIRGNPLKSSFKDNFKRAIRDCFCVPCMMCSIAERLGDARYLPYVPGTRTAVRFKVRILGGITGSICKDCVVTSCCWPCAVCQMHREMDDIGI